MDSVLFQQINQFANQNRWLDRTAVFLAEYLGYILVLILFLFLLSNSRKYWPMVVQAFGAGVLSRLVIANVIRLLWHRPRPFVEHNINLLLPPPTDSSFPSGHASFYFALAAVVYFHNKKAGFIFFVASFLMGVARVFSGVHWPSDIVAGALVGILSGWVIFTGYRRLFPSRENRAGSARPTAT